MLRYAITDRKRGAVEAQAHRLAEAGVDFVQLREKDLEAGALAALARKVLAVLRSGPAGAKLLINSRADVAVAVGADGVHLTSAAGALTAADVRAVYAAAGLPEPIVSVSCHTLAEVAGVSGADLILFGPVFEKGCGGWRKRRGSCVRGHWAESASYGLCGRCSYAGACAGRDYCGEHRRHARCRSGRDCRHSAVYGVAGVVFRLSSFDLQSWRRRGRDQARAKLPAKCRNTARSPVRRVAQPALPAAGTGRAVP